MTVGRVSPDGNRAGGPKRRYLSPTRKQSALATRVAIAAAARSLFVERGWAGTTVRAVAERASVSEPTVYNVAGSKAGLARAIVDAVVTAADAERQSADLDAAVGDPAAQLAAMIAFDCRMYEQGGDVLAVLRDAGGSTPDLAAAYAAGRAEGDVLRRRLIDRWPPGTLRVGLESDDAVDTYAALCNVSVYQVLTAERHWSSVRAERWLHHTVCLVLLAEGPSVAGSTAPGSDSGDSMASSPSGPSNPYPQSE